MKKIFILSSLIAVTLATPSFAEPSELDKKTVASKAYVDTKQDKITTGLVEFDDYGTTAAVPALVLTNAAGTALNGNTIGFLDLNTYNNLESGLDELPDTMVPSIGLLHIVEEGILNNMTALSWVVNNDNGANRINAINAYNTTFGNGTNQWAENSDYLINGEFLANSLALKQNKITTGLFDGEISQRQVQLPSLVSYDSTNGLTGNQIGILTQDEIVTNQGNWYEFASDDNNTSSHGMDNVVPTVKAVANAIKPTLAWNNIQRTAINAYSTTFGTGTNQWAGNSDYLINGEFLANSLALKQNKIAKSGYYYNTSGTLTAYGNDSNTNGWLHAGVKGTGLVTKTAGDGVVGERKIFEATDVANYHATGLTQIQQDIQDISIPTVGAVMSIVNTNAPTGTPGNVAMYDASTGALGDGVATYDGSTTYNASTDADKIAVMSGVQRKKECGGYEPGHENDPDYCWLWIFPD